MAVTTLVPVEEYLRTNYKPACDYREGVLTQKPMATWNHGLIQSSLTTLVNSQPGFRSATELTCRITPEYYLVPDLGVQAIGRIQKPYPTEPIHLVIEILSPEDRFKEAIAKCDEFIAWGVPHTWIVDPDRRRAWIYEGQIPEEVPADGALEAGPIRIPLASVFAILDQS
jgi:Uma2 family endonuclease